MIFGKKNQTPKGAADPQERIRQLTKQIAGTKNDFQKQFLLQDLNKARAELRKANIK